MAFDFDALLADNDWCRRLARKLVLDPDLAEDLVQDAWVAALENPHVRSRRSWLGGVLVHLSRQFYRTENRRKARERRAAKAEALPSAAALVEEVGLQRSLADALIELEEPWRTTLFLRYFRERPLREVAREMGVSTSTAHDREQRGLERLRSKLDGEYGGDRQAWLALLTPWVELSPGLPASSLGGIAMGTTLKISLASMAAAGLAYGVWVRQDSEPALSTPSISESRAAEERPRSQAELVRASEGSEREELARPVSSERPDAPRAVSAEIEPGPLVSARPVHGKVMDLDLRTLAGLEVRWRDGGPDQEVLATTDSGGEFLFEHVGSLEGVLVVEDPAFVTLVPGHPAGDGTETPIVVGPRLSFAGHVVDEVGRPVEGARVSVELKNGLYRRLAVARNYWTHPDGWQAESALDGSFRLDDVSGGDGVFLRVQHRDFEQAVIDLTPSADFELRIVLVRPLDEPAVWGQVVDPSGQPVPAAQVSAGGVIQRTDENGEFRLQLADAGERVELLALKAGHMPGKLEFELQSSPSPVVLELGAAPLAIEGRVVDAEGRPLPSVAVWARDLTPFGKESKLIGETAIRYDVNVEQVLGGGLGEPRHGERSTTDEEGRFRLEGLLPRAYELAVFDLSSLLCAKGMFVEAGSADIELVLEDESPQDHVQGRLLSLGGEPLVGVSVRPKRNLDPGELSWLQEGPGTPLSVTTDEEGSFLFPRLAIERTSLTFEGTGIPLFHERALSEFSDPTDLEIVIPVTCKFRVDFADHPEWADRVVVLDETETPIRLSESYGLFIAVGEEIMITEGRSGVIEADERARTLLLYKGEELVDRRRLSLQPREVVTIDL